MKRFNYEARYTAKEVDETQCTNCEAITTKGLYDIELHEIVPACTEHLIKLLYELNQIDKERVMRDGLSSGT